MIENRDAFVTRKVAIAAVFGLALCAGPAAAAPATASPPSPLKAQNTPAQPAVPDDPAKVAVAKQFIILFHPRMDPKVIGAQVDKFMPRIVEAAKKENPKLDVKKYAAERRALALDQLTTALDLQAQVVSRHFSLAELKQLVGFFGSPLGRKLAAETPNIQRELMLMGPLRRNGSSSPRVVINPSGGTAPAKPAPHK